MPVLDTGIHYRRPSNGSLDCRIESGNDERLKRFALIEAAPGPDPHPDGRGKRTIKEKTEARGTPVIKSARLEAGPAVI